MLPGVRGKASENLSIEIIFTNPAQVQGESLGNAFETPKRALCVKKIGEIKIKKNYVNNKNKYYRLQQEKDPPRDLHINKYFYFHGMATHIGLFDI